MSPNEPRDRVRSIILVLAGAIAIGSAFALPSGAFADPPPNDDFPGTMIATLPFTDTVATTEATDQEGEPLCGANESLAVWYSYTPPEDTTLRADVVGSDYGVFVSAYAGTSLADLACVAEGVYAPGDISQPAVFKATGGVTYYFQAGSASWPPETGSLTFNLGEGEPPPNDDFPGIEITSLPFTDTVDTTFATFEEEELAVWGPSVWYNYTPSGDVTLWADTFESDYRALISLQELNGTQPPGVGETQYSECEMADRVLFTAAAGETVHFQVGGSPVGQTGTLVFKLKDFPPGATPEPSPLCPELTPEPTPEPTIGSVGGIGGLPNGGGAPPPRDRWPWTATLGGGALLALASATLATALRRAQK